MSVNKAVHTPPPFNPEPSAAGDWVNESLLTLKVHSKLLTELQAAQPQAKAIPEQRQEGPGARSRQTHAQAVEDGFQGGATFTPSTGTVNFNGAGAQSVGRSRCALQRLPATGSAPFVASRVAGRHGTPAAGNDAPSPGSMCS